MRIRHPQLLTISPLNPVEPIACVLAEQLASAIRKVVGVVYLGSGRMPPAAAGVLNEWEPVDVGAVGKLKSLKAIAGEGDSLDPIARRGQWVLVGDRVADSSRLADGALAAVVMSDESVGNVLKKVFKAEAALMLVSPNAVDDIPPTKVPLNAVESLLPFAGVLFEGLDTER